MIIYYLKGFFEWIVLQNKYHDNIISKKLLLLFSFCI
jgi:hypothetical protein